MLVSYLPRVQTYVPESLFNISDPIIFVRFSISQLTLIGAIPANICWSSRRLQNMSWRRLQHVFSVTILRLPRRLEDVLKTCLEDVLKTYLEDVFKTSPRQTKFLLVISVSNKSKCVSNKSMFHKSISDKSKANPKCVT